jgi:hypothetical protein
MHVETGDEAPQLLFWEYINGIFRTVHWQQTYAVAVEAILERPLPRHLANLEMLGLFRHKTL